MKYFVRQLGKTVQITYNGKTVTKLFENVWDAHQAAEMAQLTLSRVRNDWPTPVAPREED